MFFWFRCFFLWNFGWTVQFALFCSCQNMEFDCYNFCWVKLYFPTHSCVCFAWCLCHVSTIDIIIIVFIYILSIIRSLVVWFSFSLVICSGPSLSWIIIYFLRLFGGSVQFWVSSWRPLDDVGTIARKFSLILITMTLIIISGIPVACFQLRGSSCHSCMTL